MLVQAFIFAAGLGTRLRPLTLTMPKAMVPIDGKPLVDILTDKFVAAGIGRLIVNVHHFPGQIISHLRSRADIGSLMISDESDMLRDTGGAIKYAQALIDADAPLLAHNVDIISNLDIKKFCEQNPHPEAAVLVVSRRKTSRYLLFDDSMRLQGWINEATGETKLAGKTLDPSGLHKFAFAGIQLVNPKIIGEMASFGDKFSIIDFYLAIADRYPVCGYVQPGFKMVDVGKFDSLSDAEGRAREIIAEDPCGEMPAIG